MINVLFAWLPKVFNRLMYVFGNFTNITVQILMAISIVILLILSMLRVYLDGKVLYNIYDLQAAFARNLIALNQGYFIESGVTVYGVEETTSSLEDYSSPLPLLLQQFTL